MQWGPDKVAGFALACVLADDSSLVGVRAQLPGEALEAVQSALAASTRDKSASLASWLRALRPPLDQRVRHLPPRIRALLAPHCSAPLRAQLASHAGAARPGFAADEELSSVVLRIARCAARKSAEVTT